MRFIPFLIIVASGIFNFKVNANEVLSYTANSIENLQAGYVKIKGLHLILAGKDVVKFSGSKFLPVELIGELTSPDSNANTCQFHASTQIYKIKVTLIEQTCQKALLTLAKARRFRFR